MMGGKNMQENTLKLFHTGFEKIERPDIRRGRKNADFGQGFYTTKDMDFACRWARERRDTDTVINAYELDLRGLRVRHFARDAAWYDYIFKNRSGGADALDGADVIIGPIANDTIYDTFGIITSGLLKREDALELLLAGPVYEQIVIKTQRAVEQLRFLSARAFRREEIGAYRETVAREEAEFQKVFAEKLEKIAGNIG